MDSIRVENLRVMQSFFPPFWVHPGNSTRFLGTTGEKFVFCFRQVGVKEPLLTTLSILFLIRSVLRKNYLTTAKLAGVSSEHN